LLTGLALTAAASGQEVDYPTCGKPTEHQAEGKGRPADDSPAKPAADAEPASLWSKVPPVRPFPRLGSFLVAPTGPGYYSLRDVIEGNYREAPPTFPYAPFAFYPPSFFDSDFRYLEKPDNKQHDLFDPLKRIHLGDDWLLSTGGSFWVRHMHEVGSRLSGRNNTYDLVRTRVYGDLWYRDQFRLFAEYLDAHSFSQDLPPLVIDVNRSDMLNLFADLKELELGEKPVYFRIGRQELLYGSQRLITTLDWANTRRTFQGIKGFRPGEKLDVDVFWVQPVIPDPSNFDSVDDDQNFVGIWTTYRPKKGHFFDVYYLNLDQAQSVAVGRGNVQGNFNVSTIGTRYVGDYRQVLFDAEGMYQFGGWANQSIAAGAYTVGLGYHFAKLPMNPQFWVYNDWASGDHQPGLGSTRGTFNQLFPFGHYYFGFLDQVGRQNINDFNMQLAFYPLKWITTLVQYHHFRLDSAKDALYNAAGRPLRRDPTGRAGGEVGDEIDFLVNFHVGTHQDLLIGYSKLFAGEFIQRTGSPLSPELFYFQYGFRW
jgi:hypothetical protein